MIRAGAYICFQGELGSGKTLNMTRIGAMLHLSGMACYANYPTSFAHDITSVEHLFSIRSGCLLLDELQTLLDSREFSKNVGITQWSLIVRKLGLRVLYTTQFLGQVDLRIRHITSYVYSCEPLSPVRRGGQLVERTQVDVIRWRGEGGTPIKRFVLLHSPALYALYDTKDIRMKLTTASKGGRVAAFDASLVGV